jgi:hypothetical protein
VKGKTIKESQRRSSKATDVWSTYELLNRPMPTDHTDIPEKETDPPISFGSPSRKGNQEFKAIPYYAINKAGGISSQNVREWRPQEQLKLPRNHPPSRVKFST